MFHFLDLFKLFVFKANVLLLFGWLAVTDWLDGYLARRVCVFIYFLRNVVAFRFLE